MAKRGRPTKTEAILKHLQQQPEMKTPIADELFLPNLSGDLSHGKVLTTPTQDLNPANKKYVDDEIAGIDLTPYLKTDASNDPITNNLTIQKTVVAGDVALEIYNPADADTDYDETTSVIGYSDRGLSLKQPMGSIGFEKAAWGTTKGKVVFYRGSNGNLIEAGFFDINGLTTSDTIWSGNDVWIGESDSYKMGGSMYGGGDATISYNGNDIHYDATVTSSSHGHLFKGDRFEIWFSNTLKLNTDNDGGEVAVNIINGKGSGHAAGTQAALNFGLGGGELKIGKIVSVRDGDFTGTPPLVDNVASLHFYTYKNALKEAMVLDKDENMLMPNDNSYLGIGATATDFQLYSDGTDANIDFTGDLKVNGTAGWTGTFTNGDGDTVTVADGLITGVA